MSFAVFVNGTDRTTYFKQGECSFDSNIGRRAGRLQMRISKTGWLPSVGDEIIVCDLDRSVTDGIWLSSDAANIVKSATANFVSGDLGKTIAVEFGVSAGNNYWLHSTIATINSTAEIVMSTARVNVSNTSGRVLRIEHRRYFAGIITNDGVGHAIHDKGINVPIEAIDFGVILRRKPWFTDETWTATTADVILTSILSRIDFDEAPGYGVTQGSTFPTTSVTSFRVAADDTIEDVVSNLGALIDKQIYISDRKALIVESSAAASSGVSFTTSNSSISKIEVKHRLGAEWANRAVARFGGTGEDWVDIVLTAYLNGSRTSWHVPYVIDGMPAYVSLNGADLPVGPAGGSTVWQWTPGTNSGTLSHASGGPYNVASGHTLSLRALARYPSWLYLDPTGASIEGTVASEPSESTWTVHRIIDVPETRDYRAVISYLQRWCDAHGRALVEVPLTTVNTWVTLNTTVTVTDTALGLAGGALNVVGYSAKMLVDGSFAIAYQLVALGFYMDTSADWFRRLTREA